MESLISNNVADLSRRLAELLAALKPGHQFSLTATEALSLISNLRENLAAAAACLHQQNDSSSSTQFAEYREHLVHLKAILPELQGYLLTERARLSLVRDHVGKAASWAETISITT